MAALLVIVIFAVCTTVQTSLLKDDGIYIQELGSGLQIVGYWDVFVAIKHPEPSHVLTEYETYMGYFKEFEKSDLSILLNFVYKKIKMSTIPCKLLVVEVVPSGKYSCVGLIYLSAPCYG